MFALRQMTSLSLMMTASPDDVSRQTLHHCDQREQHRICGANASYLVKIHHYVLWRFNFVLSSDSTHATAWVFFFYFENDFCIRHRNINNTLRLLTLSMSLPLVTM